MDTPKIQVGIFDSGVGGLSVLREIRHLIPAQPLIYLADQDHVPYGPRPLEEVRAFSEAVTRFLLAEGAGLIVVACNAASAAALYKLRERFPETPFVGMEPAVKPAAESTRSGKVGVLATPATFQGMLYASLVDRFANDIQIYQDTCSGLVPAIEAGQLDGAETRRILEQAILPMLADGVDTLVLGCTHYPFVIPLIRKITGEDVRIIDPAPAVARQTRRLLERHGVLVEGDLPGRVQYFTSGHPETLKSLLKVLLDDPAEVEQAVWTDSPLRLVRENPSPT